MDHSHLTVKPIDDVVQESCPHSGGFIPIQEVTTEPRKIKTPRSRDISNLYKPIKRCFYSLDQNQGKELVKNRGRGHQTARSAAESIMNGKTTRATSLTYEARSTPTDTKQPQRFLTPGNAGPIHLVRSVPSLLSSSSFSGSVQQTQVLVRSHIRSQHQTASPQIKDPVKTLKAPASIYSNSHLIRPITAMLSKSAEVLGESLRIPYQKQKSPRPKSLVSPDHSLEVNFYLPKNLNSDILSPKNRSWAKILGGSVFSNSSLSISSTPEKTSSEESDQQNFLLFSPRRERNRSKDIPGFESGPVPSLSAPEVATKPNIDSISHLNSKKTISYECIVSIQQCVRLGLSIFTMQVFLFYSCPPSYMVELGGNGMLLVYATLVIATGLLPWIIFTGDTLPDDKTKLLRKRSREYVTKFILCA